MQSASCLCYIRCGPHPSQSASAEDAQRLNQRFSFVSGGCTCVRQAASGEAHCASWNLTSQRSSGRRCAHRSGQPPPSRLHHQHHSALIWFMLVELRTKACWSYRQHPSRLKSHGVLTQPRRFLACTCPLPFSLSCGLRALRRRSV